MKKIINTIILICLFNYAPLLGSMPTIKIQITPPIYEAEIRPGENRIFELVVQNNSMKRISLNGYVRSINMDLNGNPDFIDDPYCSFSCQTWIDLNPRKFEIDPGKRRKIMVKINVPKSAEGGNYAAVLFDMNESQSEDEENKVGLVLRTGTMVLLTTRYPKKIDADISSFMIRNQIDETVFQVIIQNKSNKHIRPHGSIVIFENNRRIIDRINIQDNNFIMPMSDRLFRFVWRNPNKRKINMIYKAEGRFNVKGLGKSLNLKKEFSTSQ